MNLFLNTIVLSVAALLSFSSNVAFADDSDGDKLHIEAQPLATALQEFSEQSGLQIGYAAELANGKQSKGVAGVDDPGVALDALLKNTGLEYRFVNEDTVVIRVTATEEEGGELVPGKAQPAPSQVLVAQTPAAADPARQDQKTSSSEGLTGSLSGNVQGFTSKLRLAGVLVTVVETGQSTSTDDHGDFRFPSVPAGSYTLRVSYLGLADAVSSIRVQTGQNFQQNFVLGQAFDEIIVYGSRSARALALNKERTSENVTTVISADVLGSFTGTTISDALRRAPGVSFQRDIGTGEGTNIIVRGLSPDFNSIQLNGLNLPVGSGTGRAADLSNLLVDSVDSITINKTLLPSHDSAGTGGLVQIETKSPLSRSGRVANFTVEGGKRGGDFADEFLVSGTASDTFGENENFGLSASVQYRESTNTNIGYSVNTIPGQYLPLDPSGGTAISAIDFVDPRRLFPFESGNDQSYVSSLSSSFNSIEISTLAVTLSGEWQATEHTSLRLDLQRTEQESDRYSSSVIVQATAAAGAFGLSGGNYQVLPIQALNGELRQALTLAGGLRANQFYSTARDVLDVTESISFRGRTELGKWNFDYDAGYVEGSSSNPGSASANVRARDLVGIGFFAPAATDPSEGRIISPFGPRSGNGIPLPLLSEAGRAIIGDAANYDLAAANRFAGEGKNDRYTGKFSGRFNFDNRRWKYLEGGINFESSKFSDSNSSIAYLSNLPFDPFNPFAGVPNPSLTDLGLGFNGSGNLSGIGIAREFQNISRRDIEAFLGGVGSFTGSVDSPLREIAFDPHPLQSGAFTRENEFAAYLQGRVDLGKLEIIGGVRLSRVDVESNRLVIPRLFNEFGVLDLAFQDEFTQLAEDTATETNILPRVLINYRKSDNVIFRGGYFLSVARPQISSLSSTQAISLDLQPLSGPGFNQPALSIQEGNPALKPARTHNIDFSMEFYDNNIGVMKLGVFYKNIDNLIENNFVFGGDDLTGVILPDHPAFQNLPANLLVSRSRPVNNDSSASIWGAEVQVERQFTFLPGILDGLGIFANYTYSESSKDSTATWTTSPVLDADGNFILVPDFFNPLGPGNPLTEQVTIVYLSVPFDQQPEHSGTVALTYNKYNIDGALTYGFQSRLRRGDGDFGLSPYNEGVETLDFRAEYILDRWSGTYRIYVEATDLLRGRKDVDLEQSIGGAGGVPRLTTGGTYLGGRGIKLGVTASF